jgi:hypothetical protein
MNTKTNQELLIGQKNVNHVLYKSIAQKAKDIKRLAITEILPKSECNGKWKLLKRKKSTN